MSNKAWDAGQRGSAGGEHVDHLLSAYIDKDLDAKARAQVRKHLRECADCRADYVELQATLKLLGSLPTVAPPRAFTITPEMAEAQNPRLARAAAGKGGFWERIFAPRNAPRFAFGSVVSVVLTLVVLAGGLLSNNNRDVVSVGWMMEKNAPAAGFSPANPTNMPRKAFEDQNVGQPPAEKIPSTMSASALAAPTSTTGAAASQDQAAPPLEGMGGGAAGISAQSTATPALSGVANAQPGVTDTSNTTASGNAVATVTLAAPSGIAPAPAPTLGAGQGDVAMNQTGNAAPGARISISTPAPESAPASPSVSAFESWGGGGGLFLSFSVLFGLLSILLATAALISTRNRR